MSSAVLSICIGLTELSVGDFHQEPLEGAGKEAKRIDCSAAPGGRKFRSSFTEGKDCALL